MNLQRVFLSFLYLAWIVVRYAIANKTNWLLENMNKEFGTRLKKLRSDYYMPRKNTLNENTYQKLNHAGHEWLSDKNSTTKQKHFARQIKESSPNFKTPQNASTLNLLHKDVSADKKLEQQNKLNLVRSQNLNFNNIEPYWPFSNLTASFLDHGFKSPEHSNGFPYNNLPDRFKDTTFFFSHIGPNRFEYRAQFHHNHHGQVHHQHKDFKPFVHDFPEFPKITFPPFPTYPGAPEIFNQPPQFPVFPEFNPFTFPTLPPSIKRNLETPTEPKVPEVNNHRQYDGPYNQYDVGLGNVGSQYPKIFRFNEERINIADFEKEKKRQAKLNALNYNLVQPENVQRDHLLILHGGIFTVQEPPLYHRKVIRKRRQRLRKRIGRI